MDAADMMPSARFLTNWDWAIVRCWINLEDWVVYRRGLPAGPPDLWHHFEALAARARQNLINRGVEPPTS